jgi:hypothetical protein
MAMTPKIWTVSALSVEFDIDRRTVAKRLAKVPADGKSRGVPGWFLTTAAPILQGVKPAPKEPLVPRGLAPDGGQFTTGSAIAEALALGMLMMAERAPAAIASALVRSGVPIRTAREAFGTIAVSLMALVDDIAVQEGIKWRSEEHFPMPLPPSWSKLCV